MWDLNLCGPPCASAGWGRMLRPTSHPPDPAGARTSQPAGTVETAQPALFSSAKRAVNYYIYHMPMYIMHLQIVVHSVHVIYLSILYTRFEQTNTF